MIGCCWSNIDERTCRRELYSRSAGRDGADFSRTVSSEKCSRYEKFAILFQTSSQKHKANYLHKQQMTSNYIPMLYTMCLTQACISHIESSSVHFSDTHDMESLSNHTPTEFEESLSRLSDDTTRIDFLINFVLYFTEQVCSDSYDKRLSIPLVQGVTSLFKMRQSIDSQSLNYSTSLMSMPTSNVSAISNCVSYYRECRVDKVLTESECAVKYMADLRISLSTLENAYALYTLGYDNNKGYKKLTAALERLVVVARNRREELDQELRQAIAGCSHCAVPWWNNDSEEFEQLWTLATDMTFKFQADSLACMSPDKCISSVQEIASRVLK